MVGNTILLLFGSFLVILPVMATPTSQVKPIIAGLITKCEHKKDEQNAMGMLISERMNLYMQIILRNSYTYHDLMSVKNISFTKTWLIYC